MTARSRRWRTAAGLIVLVVGMAGLAGCSGSASQSTAPEMAAGDTAARGEAAAPAAEAPKEGGDAQQAPTQVEAQQRSLVYTGTMHVKVDDVVAQANRAVDIAEAAGGAIGADRRTLDADRSEAQLVLRVPADRFASILDELAKLGTEESRAVQTQDVTEALVDLDARLLTQRTSVERVRALLARAQTIGEVVSVEAELARREAELASLEQRKDKLAGLVALSTITLNLRGPATPEPTEPDTGFVAGLKSGWTAFLESVKVVLTVAGWLLPWVIAVGAPIWLVVWLLRRRRRPVPVPTPVMNDPTP